MSKAERFRREQLQAIYQEEQEREVVSRKSTLALPPTTTQLQEANRKPKDQIVTLCLLQRMGKIGLGEFGQRLAAMLEDPDTLANIAIDVEQLVDNQQGAV